MNDVMINSGVDFDIYTKLCRGAANINTKLQCRLSSNRSPYKILSPLHIETLSLDPMVIMVHDFLTESEMKFLKFTTMSELKVVKVEVDIL